MCADDYYESLGYGCSACTGTHTTAVAMASVVLIVLAVIGLCIIYFLLGFADTSKGPASLALIQATPEPSLP